jgi:hypothetical protein
LPKSPKDLPGVEFADLEIAGATERDRAGVAKGLPESLRARSIASAGVWHLMASPATMLLPT